MVRTCRYVCYSGVSSIEVRGVAAALPVNGLRADSGCVVRCKGSWVCCTAEQGLLCVVIVLRRVGFDLNSLGAAVLLGVCAVYLLWCYSNRLYVCGCVQQRHTVQSLQVEAAFFGWVSAAAQGLCLGA
jgi:hypothetical protein